MIVHHAGRLHEGVHNGWADKGETGSLQSFRHGLGFCGCGRYFGEGAPMVLDRFIANKRPEEITETDTLFPQIQITPGILDDRPNL